MIFRFFLSIAFLLWPLAVHAAEVINDFDVRIEVFKNGDIAVTETIAVTVEGKNIRRGVFRDLPRYYSKSGVKYPYRYDVKSVTRNGRKELYARETEGNAFRIRIGDKDVLLQHGRHVYVISYTVKNQIRYFEGYDELYWNATGNDWAFPIENARAAVILPDGATVTGAFGYTGMQGAGGGAYTYTPEGSRHIFATTRPLNAREGLTLSVAFEKGAVDPPSAADSRAEWWARNVSLVILASLLGFLSVFYAAAFNRYGRDPQKGPVFPRYDPPEGYSPAALHHIYHRSFSGHNALIATFLNLATKDRLKIDARDKKKTELTLLNDERGKAGSANEERLLRGIFNRREKVILGGGVDAAFTKAYQSFREHVGDDFGKPFFKWNAGILLLAVLVLALGLIAAAVLSVAWTSAHTALAVSLVAMTLAFSYFIPAPTVRGQRVRTEVEGFRLYLKTAEKLQLDAAVPGSDTPPPMTVERYERFLPYAVALGVEEPWTKHFEQRLPKEAASYEPRWSGYSGGHHSLHGMTSALVSGLSSGVVSAMPQSSTTSGSGGGGFSGGGGGGGGGGGW